MAFIAFWRNPDGFSVKVSDDFDELVVACEREAIAQADATEHDWSGRGHFWALEFETPAGTHRFEVSPLTLEWNSPG